MTAFAAHIALPAVGAALRRHRLDDLDALAAAVEESRDHLRPHMPWADESRADLAAFLAEAVAQWGHGADRNYLIVDAADDRVLGGCGVHDRIGPRALEIGYWLRAGETGRGVATAAAGALTAAALASGAGVEIHCDEANTASAAVARRLGYRLDRIEDDHISAPADVGRSMIWVAPPRDTRTVYSEATAATALREVRRICLALPEVVERASHGSPAFFVRGKKTIVSFVDDHHGDGRLAIWCAAPPGVQAQLVEQEPDRFFRPPYVGHRGWLGVQLDRDPDWDEVAAICADAYRQVAPKSLIARLDAERDR